MSRRSQREFGARTLSLVELGQLAWAAQGITDRSGPFRTAPSAGALYPLELYFATPSGVSHYLPAGHAFEHRGRRDLRPELARAALDQPAVRQAPCVIVITAVTARTAHKYGERAGRYVALEAGHVAQNLLLQAASLNLAAVPIGAFDDAALRRVLGLDSEEVPLYIVAMGPPVAG